MKSRQGLHIGVFVLRDLELAGGSLVRIVGITKYLTELGHRVTLFAPTFTSQLEGKVNYVQLPENCIRRSFSVEHAAFPFLTPLRYCPADNRLLNLIEAQKLDIIHCHQHESAFRLMKISRRLNIPIAFEIHGIIKLQRSDLRVFAKSRFGAYKYLNAERNVFRSVNGVFVRSENEGSYIAREFKVPTESIHIVPDGADVEYLGVPMQQSKHEQILNELGLSTNKRTLFFAGEFKLQSGLVELIEIFKRLISLRDDVQMLLIGDGALMQQIRATVAEIGSPRVVVTGRVSRDLFRDYQSVADIMIAPEIDSAYNNLGASIKLFECLASGKPTIASATEFRKTIIEDGVNGYLVKADDEEQWLACIQRVLDDPGSLQVGAQGRKMVEENYSWRRFTNDAVKAYEKILAEYNN